MLSSCPLASCRSLAADGREDDMGIDWPWVMIIGGALLILVEVALGGFAGFDIVLIGSAVMLGGAIGKWTHNPEVGFVVASLGCLLYLAAGRRYVRHRMQPTRVPSNADAVVGQRALVTAALAPHQAGQVRVRDEVWRALPAPGQSAAIEPGAEVVVEAVDGVTLLVRR